MTTKYKLTDMHGARGVICEVKDSGTQRNIPNTPSLKELFDRANIRNFVEDRTKEDGR